MRAKITFDFVEFMQDTGDTVRVALGQSFGMTITDGQPNLMWATTKDQVLNVVESSASADVVSVSTLTKGTSKVMLLNSTLNSTFFLNIEVYDSGEAVSLGASASTPVSK